MVWVARARMAMIVAGLIGVVFAKGPEALESVRFHAEPGEYTVFDLADAPGMHVTGAEVLERAEEWVVVRVHTAGTVSIRMSGCIAPPAPGPVRVKE